MRGTFVFIGQLSGLQKEIEIVPEGVNLVVWESIRETFQSEEVFGWKTKEFSRVLNEHMR